MKRYQKWMATLLVGLTMITGFSVGKAKAQPGAYVSYQTFYDELSPYGEWINDPKYGYVWVPDVDQNFQPYYTEGRWVMTEYGNTWVSDYSWGWAPFHYGRWTYDEYYGWLWIPDSEWGPAWVSWRTGGGVYGWAPLGPGISISSSYGGYNAPYDWWIFVPCNNIYSHSYSSYYRGPRYNQTYIRNTTFVNYTNNYNHVTYTTGPRANEIRNYTKQPVTVYNVRNQPRASVTVVNNNSVNIFRPQVRNNGGARPVPQNAIRPDHRIGAPQPVSVNNGRPQGPRELRGQQNNPRPERTPQNPNNGQQPAQQAPRQQPQREPRQIPVQQQQPREDRQPRQMPVQQQQQQQPAQQAPRQQPQREPRQMPMQQQQQPQREPRQMPVQQQQPREDRQPRQMPVQQQPQQQPRENRQPRVEPPREQRPMPAQQQQPRPQQQREERPQPQQAPPAEREHGGRR